VKFGMKPTIHICTKSILNTAFKLIDKKRARQRIFDKTDTGLMHPENGE
jgi:hypothetical protein